MEESKPLLNNEYKQLERVWRTCKHCSWKWLGKPSATICSKCKRYIGAVKKEDLKETSVGGEVKVENVYSSLSSLPPLPETVKPEEKIKEGVTKADIPADTYTSLVSLPFDLVASTTKKPHWKLTSKEKESLAPLLKVVGDKWVSKWFEKYPEEGALAIAFGMVIMGKFALEIAYRKEHKKEKEQYPNLEKDKTLKDEIKKQKVV